VLTPVSVCCKLYNIDVLQATHLLCASRKTSTVRFRKGLHSTLLATYLLYASSYGYFVLVGQYALTLLPPSVCHSTTYSKLLRAPRPSRSDERAPNLTVSHVACSFPLNCSTRRYLLHDSATGLRTLLVNDHGTMYVYTRRIWSVLDAREQSRVYRTGTRERSG